MQEAEAQRSRAQAQGDESPASVFLSYAREDREAVVAIASQLKLRGIAIYADWLLEPGPDFRRQIDPLILKADEFIACLSPEFALSAPCGDEVKRASGLNKRFLPVVVRDGFSDAGLPEIIRTPHWTFLRPGDDFESAIDALAAAVRTEFDLIPMHTYLLLRAEEWKNKDRNRSLLLRGAALKDAETWLPRASADVHRLPNPTELQSEFIVASQKARAKARTVLASAAIGVAVALGALAIYATIQSGIAERQTELAEQGRLQAIAAREEAERQRDRALVNERSALARELAFAASSALEQDQERGVLLGVEAVKATYSLDRKLLGTGDAADTPDSRYFAEKRVIPQAAEALHRALLAVAPWHTLRGHRSIIYALSWSPDSRRLATAGNDLNLKIWDGATGAELRNIALDSWGVDVSWSPDGKRIATAAKSGTAAVWNAATGAQLWARTLGAHSVAFSPDGRLLAMGGFEGHLMIWDLKTSVGVRSRTGHKSQVWSVAWRKDGRQIVTGSLDGTAKMWDPASGNELRTLSHPPTVTRAAWSPDGRFIATAGSPTAKVWESETGSEWKTLQGHREQLQGVAWSPDGKIVGSASQDNTARLWDASTGRELATLPGGLGQNNVVIGVQAIGWSPDGKWIATANVDFTARTWKADLGYEIQRFAGERSVAYSPNGTLVAAAGDPIRVFDTIRRRVVREMKPASPVISMQWSPDGQSLATGDHDRTVRIWNIKDGSLLHQLKHDDPVRTVDVVHIAAAWHPDGRHVATAAFGPGVVKVWDTRTRIHREFRASSDDIRGLAWNAGGTKLATCGDDLIVRVWQWDGLRAQLLHALPTRHSNTLMTCTWNPDGTRLAVASADHTVDIWDVGSRKLLFQLIGHQGPLRTAAWSPDGSLLATASFDRTVKVWDAARPGQALFTFAAHNSDVQMVSWSADGKHLASAGADGWVKIHTMDADELLALAARRTSRPLTDDECRTYLHRSSCAAGAR